MALTQIDDRGLKTPIDLIDNEKIRFGTGNDLEIFHQSGSNFIKNAVAGVHLKIKDADGDDMAIFNQGGGVQLYYDNTEQFKTTSTGVYLPNANATLDLPDNGKLRLGQDTDASIWHDGSNAYIQNTTGALYIQPKASENAIKAVADGAVSLYYDDVEKLKTDSAGVEVTGAIIVADGSDTGNRISLGDAGDLKIYHNGTDNFIKNVNGEFKLLMGSEYALKATANGKVVLYYNDSDKFETTDTGVKITDSTLEIADTSCHIDLMETSATNHRIRNGSGNFYIQKVSDDKSTTTDQFKIDGGTGVVELYHNGTKRFETTSDGIQVTGTAAYFKAPDGGARYYFGEMANNQNAQLSLYNSSDAQQVRISATPYNSDASFMQSDFVIGSTATTGGTSSGRLTIEHSGLDSNAVKLRNTNTGSAGQNAIVFIRASSQVGSIETSDSSTTYNTSSDYRLKENIVGISDGITRLKTLKPSRFNFKVDPTKTVDGFLAHEVTAVPEAVSGTKDAVATEDNDGLNIKKDDPIYQQIDQSKLVPLLTAALQEAITKIETLETKVAALEAA